VLSAIRADNARRVNEGRRPRFRVLGNKLALGDWALDSDLGRAEREFYAALDRLREASRRSLLRSLQELPQRAIGEAVVLLLEQMGYVELLPVRRPGSHGAEIHLSGRARGAVGEIRTAVVLRRDGREIGRERVTELRGALHHYGSSAAGLLITTGQVLSGAREEAAAPGAAPIAVVDGIGLARLCEEHGVAVAARQVRVPLPDWDLLDGLRASAG
jgi:restriction endonuclease Mrr